MPLNRTTGYEWRLAESPSSEILRSDGSRYDAPAAGIPGQGGSEAWAFYALGKGRAGLMFEYVQPWDKSAGPARTQAFEVTVN